MSLLFVKNLSKSFGPNDLFQNVSFSIPSRARIGLVGPNGVGKTTLVRILLGLEEPTGGEVQKAKGVRLGYLPQNATLESGSTLWQECLSPFADLIAMQQKLSWMEHALGEEQSEAVLESALEAYGRLQAEFERQGGYTYETRIRQALAGLGFSPADFDRPLWQLSGGQRTRAYLARLLLSDPDVLLLDEPTNHLDIAATEWLESYLREWHGALLFISHDRYFLDQVASAIVEMSHTVRQYQGNYSAYIRQREAYWDRLQQLFDAEKARLEKDLDYVKRNIAGQRTQQAKGRLRRLSRELDAVDSLGIEALQGKRWAEIAGEADISEHIQGVEEVERRIRSLRMPQNRPPQLKFHLKASGRSGDLVVRTHGLEIGYQDEGRPLFAVPDLTLLRGECAGVIGPNGAGKTTFLKTLLGQLPPFSGEVTLGASLQIGYFAQAHESLRPERTLVQEIEAVAPDLRPAEIRDYLARFLFGGDDVFKPVAVLSGGERGRLALAVLALTHANLLLLDEPTNHLDLPSQEMLQSVLAEYQGTILIVSHDRYLIDALASQVWEVDPDLGMLRVFDGTYTEYRAARQAEEEAVRQPAAVRAPAGQTVEEATERNPRPNTNRERQRRQRLTDLEREISTLEDELARISRQLETPPADPTAVQRLAQAYAHAQQELDARLDAWAQLSEEIEAANA